MNCSRLWSRSGRLCDSFHGFAQFLAAVDCKIALVQETNTPAAPSLPEDQPFVFDGHEHTLGRDAAFLVHQNQSATCIPIPNTTQHADICWRLVSHGESIPSTAIASFYAPHVGCPESDRLAFWQRLSDSIGEVLQAVPGVDVVIAGDSNLWIPGLVHACEQRSADRTCLASLQTLLQTFGLEICNPNQQPTHSRGAALDLVIASPGLVGSVHVHNRSCNCTDAELCCPLLSSDHYAVEINLMKRLIQAAHAPNADAPVKHVRNWGDLLQAQEEKLKEWSRMIQSHLADPEPLANAPRRPVLDILYGDLLDILWHADPSLYRHPRVHSQTQPSWWNEECFEALLARNAAWRQRNRAPEMDCTFRSARNHFHRVVRSAKAKHWSNWLHRVEQLQRVCPRAAAHVVRRRFRKSVCRVAPRLSPSSLATLREQNDCMNRWRMHFRDAAPMHVENFDARHFSRVRRRVQFIRSTRDSQCHVHGGDGTQFTLAELKTALQHCHLDKAPGCDKIPYRALCVDIPWWQDAILKFLELCRLYGCIPSVWKHGVVVPLAKSADASDRNDYRPITLTSCFAKPLEKMILNRIKPSIDPQLDTSQAGFRWGSDTRCMKFCVCEKIVAHFVPFSTSGKHSMQLGVMVPC